jgi:hypothetical protein
MSKVLNVASHPIDLDDGRTLAPGEEAVGVNLNITHNKVAVAQGLLIEVKSAPAKKQSSRSASTDTTGEEETQ